MKGLKNKTHKNKQPVEPERRLKKMKDKNMKKAAEIIARAAIENSKPELVEFIKDMMTDSEYHESSVSFTFTLSNWRSVHYTK